MNVYRPLRTRARKMYLVTKIILHMSHTQGLTRKKTVDYIQYATTGL